ncbi:hypothetical protein [Bifidobacterium catenulatum]|uniref:hypothetical protein n=1 Tax=Bifidobacterium catenulatum TaxID=1686 RepID=UPI003F92B802
MTEGFSEDMQIYLRSLPAVVDCTADRISYASWFRVEAVNRYRNGEGPTKIFRSRGLGPENIGHKRIERCMDRWKKLYGGKTIVSSATDSDTNITNQMDTTTLELQLDAMEAEIANMRATICEIKKRKLTQ